MERLQKILAQAGLGSRRFCETLITEGVVKVNGKLVTELGTKVDPEKDVIYVKGRRVESAQKVYLILNKPQNYITSLSDPGGRRIITDLIPRVKERVYPVGRLDYDSEGLLLLTNDGELANRLMHPRYKVGKLYFVVVKGVPDTRQIKALEHGVVVEGVKTMPAKVKILKRFSANKTSLYLEIREGKKHQVKNMLGTIGLPVEHLKRVRIGCIKLGDLPRGKYRYLKKNEIKELRGLVGLK
ncbi:MAG: pseudouridine synthase [Armatimonadota bacterium]